MVHPVVGAPAVGTAALTMVSVLIWALVVLAGGLAAVSFATDLGFDELADRARDLFV